MARSAGIVAGGDWSARICVEPREKVADRKAEELSDAKAQEREAARASLLFYIADIQVTFQNLKDKI